MLPLPVPRIARSYWRITAHLPSTKMTLRRVPLERGLTQCMRVCACTNGAGGHTRPCTCLLGCGGDTQTTPYQCVAQLAQAGSRVAATSIPPLPSPHATPRLQSRRRPIESARGEERDAATHQGRKGPAVTALSGTEAHD